EVEEEEEEEEEEIDDEELNILSETFSNVELNESNFNILDIYCNRCETLIGNVYTQTNNNNIVEYHLWKFELTCEPLVVNNNQSNNIKENSNCLDLSLDEINFDSNNTFKYYTCENFITNKIIEINS